MNGGVKFLLLVVCVIAANNGGLMTGEFEFEDLIGGEAVSVSSEQNALSEELEAIAEKYGFFYWPQSGYAYFEFPQSMNDRKDEPLCTFWDFIRTVKRDLVPNLRGADMDESLSEGEFRNVNNALEAGAYKIHLMPYAADLPAIIGKLCQAIIADETLAGLIKTFKIANYRHHILKTD